MVNYPITKIEKNEIVQFFLKKPKFLSHKEEKTLIDFVKENKIKEFYNYSSKLIKNTRDVINLYIYLNSKLEKLNIANSELKNQVCWRLFNISSIGWMNLKDSEIIKYCNNNTTDKVILKEIKKIKFANWYDKYKEFVIIEKLIEQNIKDVEKNVEKYLNFIKSLLKSKGIKQKEFEDILNNLIEETSIYKNKQLIGSLISKKLQHDLRYKTIVPKLEIKSEKENKKLE